MELIYLYVGDVGRPLKDQGVRFGRSFEAAYQAAEKRLIITRRGAEGDYDPLYQAPVVSLNLLVGKNGTGKSTMLELLGFPEGERLGAFPLRSDGENPLPEEDSSREADRPGAPLRRTWFALYHLREDWFALEGYWCELLDFLDQPEFTDQTSPDWLWPVYSVSFRYDLEKKEADRTTVRYLQDFWTRGGSPNGTEGLFYLFYRTAAGLDWVQEPGRENNDKIYNDHLFPRAFTDRMDYRGIERYLYAAAHQGEFLEAMGGRIGTVCLIRTAAAMDAEDRAAFQRQGGTKAQQMALLYLWLAVREADEESAAMAERFEDGGENAGENAGEDPGPYRRLRRALEAAADYEAGKKLCLTYLGRCNESEGAVARALVEGIEQIPERFLQVRAGEGYVAYPLEITARIAFQDMEEDFLQPLMTGLDLMRRSAARSSSFDEGIDHRELLSVTFEGISTGEAHYLDFYASLYNALRNAGNAGNHHPGDTCVLLLDEPDSRFHPDWSRQFIARLTGLLQSALFRDYRYQVIISSHSPLLMSDVPRDRIRCLDRETAEGPILLKQPDYGFMSAFSDILKEGFFTKSIWGLFAEDYTNRLIRDINALDGAGADPAAGRAALADIRARLQVIDDGVIRESLRRRVEAVAAAIERGTGL